MLDTTFGTTLRRSESTVLHRATSAELGNDICAKLAPGAYKNPDNGHAEVHGPRPETPSMQCVNGIRRLKLSRDDACNTKPRHDERMKIIIL